MAHSPARGSWWPICQPPCRKPPLGSSSAPPGACETPSRLTNSLTISLRICDLLSECRWYLIRPARARELSGSGVEHDRDRPVVDQLDGHPGAEAATLHRQARGGQGAAEPLVDRFGE